MSAHDAFSILYFAGGVILSFWLALLDLDKRRLRRMAQECQAKHEAETIRRLIAMCYATIHNVNGKRSNKIIFSSWAVAESWSELGLKALKPGQTIILWYAGFPIVASVAG